MREPDPSKKVLGADPLHGTVTKDALREQQADKAAGTKRPRTASAARTTPPVSPTMLSSPRVPTAGHAGGHGMPRNMSIDSVVSVSSVPGASAQRNSSTTEGHRASPDSIEPQAIATLIQRAGTPEAAIKKLITEKNHAASHNEQLWRLVEKQRSMILGLNKDLEKVLKEKDRYRRKLKDNLAQSQSAPLPVAASDSLQDLVRNEAPSAAAAEQHLNAAASLEARDKDSESRKLANGVTTMSTAPGRSDTPLEISDTSTLVLTSTSMPANDANVSGRDVGIVEVAQAPVQANGLAAQIALLRAGDDGRSPSPRFNAATQSPGPSKSVNHAHQKSLSQSSVYSSSPPASTFASPKVAATRRAPPAPLNLSSQDRVQTATAGLYDVIDAFDSEYEDDPESARAEQTTRGRRKTREDDDREREKSIQQQAEYASRSKSGKSKSKAPPEAQDVTADLPPAGAPLRQPDVLPEEISAARTHQSLLEPSTIIRQQVAASPPQGSTAPSLLSPGLPMSPRPGDRPMNSPMPRAPNKLLNSIPMSPKSGISGLPLSPRAPRQPIPMPPQSLLSIASPHLARAEGYQITQMQPKSLAHMLESPADSPERERSPSNRNEPIPMSPGEIYQGLVTDQYPNLLLPPNALPSIFVKTASSRMKPSRQSLIAPKAIEENPVFTLAVHQRADDKQLWRVEKTFAALAQLDEQIKAVCSFRERLPDKVLFHGHAPARMDARRAAIDHYFHKTLDSVTEDKPAKVVCSFLSTDAIGATTGPDYFGGAIEVGADTLTNKKPHREGYLTKRGKNFGGWKARYFVLDGPNLKYYDGRGGAQLGSIRLQNAQIGKQSNSSQSGQEDEDNQIRHAFLVLEPKKKDATSLVRHILCAESDEERDAWVDALLQYVDPPEEQLEEPQVSPSIAVRFDEPKTSPAKVVRPDTSAIRAPRLQKSMNDLRPASKGRDLANGHEETLRAVGYDSTVAGDPPNTGRREMERSKGQVRAVGYNDTVAGETPIMVATAPPRKVGTPSPTHDGGFGTAFKAPGSGNPNISAPTNIQLISNNNDDWGMKSPSNPYGPKEKKRGIFHGLRGRSISDATPNEKLASPGFQPQDHHKLPRPRAVFGAPLAEAVHFARPIDVDTELPAVVYRCIEYLYVKNAVAEEGIFRLSGSNSVVKGLKDRFNNEGDVCLVAEDTYYDVHAVAGLLKLYLRELPHSVLTKQYHIEFLGCLEPHAKNRVATLNALVNKLPRANRALLEALSSILLSIVENADVNKMNVRNG